MTIYKNLEPSDVKTARSFLSQLIDVIQEDISGSTSRRKYQVFVTGGIGPGVTSSLFQTVYDQDFTLQTANQVFDCTIGLFSGSSVVASSLVGVDSVGKELICEFLRFELSRVDWVPLPVYEATFENWPLMACVDTQLAVMH